MTPAIPPRPSPGAPPKYPLATVAAYGPDNTRATKLVVSVIRRPGRAPSDSRVWYTLADDVRNDETVAAEVAAWLASHRVKQTTSYDRIIGCPHQEGIDYPMGRVCPQCPFWAHIDRFTHEPVVPPEATMTADEVLAELMADRPVQPLDALVSADAHREALVEPLLQAMASALADPKGTSDPIVSRDVV